MKRKQSIEVITTEKATAIFNSGPNHYEPRGKYIVKDESHGRVIAIDNNDGHAWTEEFDDRATAEEWLRGEFEIDEMETI